MVGHACLTQTAPIGQLDHSLSCVKQSLASLIELYLFIISMPKNTEKTNQHYKWPLCGWAEAVHERP